jgi:uncharacterized repeat protein (TIGR02543 family)
MRGHRRVPLFLAAVGALALLGPSAAARTSAPGRAAAQVLAVSKAGTGGGTVTSLPPGIDCGSTCAASFPDGAVVTLIANADNGSNFTGWSGACTGTSPSCQVVMTAPQAVTATFTAILPPPSGPPTTGHDVDVQPVTGKVLVKLPGKRVFVSLKRVSEIPVGSQVDTTKGKVKLVSALRRGKLNRANFYDGLFEVRQVKKPGAVTDLVLRGSIGACKQAATLGLQAKKKRRLWGSGKGRFRTRGNYSSATVRGTIWEVEDSCAGTLTRVSRGVVEVRDFIRKKTVFVHAGQTYLAKAPKPKRPKR